MSTICPICGKEDTLTFMDTVTKEHGFHCEDCHHDFGVDDGSKLSKYEKNLSSFHYESKEKGTVKIVDIVSKGNEATFVLTLKKPDALSYLKTDPMDFSSDYESFKKFLFENLFFLDWIESNKDSTKEHEKEVTIECIYKLGLLPPIKKEYALSFPPYLVALERLFDTLFENLKETENV